MADIVCVQAPFQSWVSKALHGRPESLAFFHNYPGQMEQSRCFLLLHKSPIFFKFMPSPSFVEMEITSGLLLRICAFAAINTGVSVIPFASLAAVFPVHGMIASTSRNPFGPIGSALSMDTIGSFPVISFIF